MNLRDENAAVLNPYIAADEEWSWNHEANNITSEENKNRSCQTEKTPAGRKHDDRWYDPDALDTVSMTELYETSYPGRQSVIDGLLSAGTYIFAGAPKVGKSFLMAQLAYHVSTGLPLWGYPVRQGTVLYLALEDDFRRLQSRLYRMFGTEAAENLHLAVFAKKLNTGLVEQLAAFLREYPNTRLIIIDTLQKIRESSGDKCSYAADYEVIGQLKQFADRKGVCLLLVHHTRKQQADDRFDMISGTNGLMGAADGAFLLHKESRTSPMAKLDISGRDQQDQRIILRKDPESLRWELDHAEVDAYREAPDPVLDAVAALLTEGHPEWNGTATELAELLPIEIKPISLAMKLNIRSAVLEEHYHVRFKSSRSRTGRSINLSRISDAA